MLPKKEVSPGTKSGATNTHTTTSEHHQAGFLHGSAAHRNRRRNPPHWRYADDWRDAFARGALDALRCASRATADPAVWALLDELADRYSDPDDDYGLAR